MQNKKPMYAVRDLICATCGETKTGRFPKRQRYCSWTCSTSGRGKSRQTGQVVACAQCSKSTYRAPSATAKTGQHFCSRECANAFQGRNKTEHTCITCGHLFKWSPSRIKTNQVQYCSIRCRDDDPSRRAQLLAMNNLQQHGKTTSCERLGYAMLESLGCAYIAQHMIGGKFCVDAYLPEHNLVVQFDGDYWHGNPSKYTALDHRQQKRVQYDRSQDAYMQASGLTVFRAWHSDLQRNVEEVKAQLQRLLVRT